MLQRLISCLALATVFMAACGSTALAAGAQSGAAPVDAEPPHTALAGMPAESRQFLLRGINASLSGQQIEALLNEFERDLTRIYSELGGTLAPVLNKQAITNDEKEMVATSTRQAAGRIVSATQKALKPFAFSDAELSRLLPKFHYFSTETKLSIRQAYPDTNQDARDEVIMPQPSPLLYFLAGLSRRVGIYIDIKADKRVIGNAFIINFPAYYISRSGQEQLTGMREDIRRFLWNPAFSDVVATLYDSGKQQFRMVWLGKSAAYALDEVAGNYGTYGMNDTLDGRDRILIYEDNIRYRTRRLADKWRKYLQNSVEIHEMMHALHREHQPACADAIDKRVVAENLDEAQAEAASLAVLAGEQDESLNYALYMKLHTGWSNPPHLVYDDFYHGILKAVLQRKFNAWRTHANANAPLAASPIPKFFQVVPESDRAAKLAGPGFLSLGSLSIGGKDGVAVGADVAHLDADDRMALLFDATPQDVLEQAHAALAEVVRLENRLCQ